MRKKLIDKDALAREIENLKSNLIYGACASQIAMETRCKEEAYNEVLSYLDTLEVKEVDLNKEIYDAEKRFGDIDEMGGYRILLFDDEFRDVLRHFFELGLKKARKGK